MPAPRRSRRRQGQEAQPGQAGQWPLFRATSNTLIQAELEAQQIRARLLIEQGWGAISDWLLAPITPAERRAQQALQAQLAAEQQALADVFGD